ncbi:MAG: hypothetical protein ACRDLS_01420 [Solirubrobacteraceae bacterium]
MPDVDDPTGAGLRTSASAQITGTQAAATDDPNFPRNFKTLFARPVPGLYEVNVQPQTDWVTARNDVKQLVIGNAADNGKFYVDEKKAPDGSQTGGMRGFYYHGRVRGQLQRCAWIDAYKTDYVGSLPGSGVRPCGEDHRLSPNQFARLINCDQCNDGAPVRLRGQNSKYHQELLDRQEISWWRNVQPGTNEGNSPRTGTFDPSPNGERVVVRWRYLTKSRGRVASRFALVRAENDDLFGPNKWAFIERKWLPHTSGKGGLCDNTGDGPPRDAEGDPDKALDGERLDYTSEKAKGNKRRKNRGDWGQVCSHRFFSVPRSDASTGGP